MSKIRMVRSVPTQFSTRDDGGELSIEGYFAVFNSTYEIDRGMSESIAPGAFAAALDRDVRALVNHDTTLVLGRNKAGTLELREDERGLWGHVAVNPNDRAAMDLYERVKRGDVDQCSFGFSSYEEDTDVRENGDVHWTLTRIDLDEVSCCTFPAYEATSISARSAERDVILERRTQAWKENMKKRLKGDKDGT